MTNARLMLNQTSLSPLFRWLGLCLIVVGAVEAQETFFTDVTEQALRGTLFQARGNAFGDYDNDGWPDLFLSEDFTSVEGFSSHRIQLLHNEGNGGFAEITEAIQTEFSPDRWKGGGTIFGDYDNDGDLDLYVPVGVFLADSRGLNRLLRNDRGVFADVTVEAGLIDEIPTDNAVWLDYNRDGHLDLFTTNPEFEFFGDEVKGRNILYQNTGDGTFIDATEESGLAQLQPGTTGGVVASDFNDDRWPDLFIANFFGPSMVFINNGRGEFRDISTSDIALDNQAWGIAVGDIDNDGDVDLFQANGGVSRNPDTGPIPLGFRSQMFLNLGSGEFLDVTEGVGLSRLIGLPVFGTGLADIDSDGDLDLISATTHGLFLNDSTGIMAEHTSESGIDDVALTVCFSDYDLDGDLDVFFSSDSTFNAPPSIMKLYRNNGPLGHYLQIELVGNQSNRNGIGARLIAVSDGLRQVREILGGRGFEQDEMVAYFGLGVQTQVDTLTVRWPSGQVDMLTDIPADQRIRVIEGRGEYYPVLPTVWEVPPPENLVMGQSVNLDITVRPALFEPAAEITSVTGNLSRLGGPEALPLEDLGNGAYRLGSDFVVGDDHEMTDVEVFIEQETSLGPHWISLKRRVEVTDTPNTAVLEDYSATVPSAFTLSQNAPNPFNSSTVIRFALSESRDIELSVYNLAGQKISTLVEGIRQAGSYSINWNGRDDADHQLPSGVYLYRLKASGGKVETRKLLMLK